MHNSHKELKEISYCVKNALFSHKDETILFKSFPNGCCRDASVLLGLYLSEKGYETTYCHKEYDDHSISHGWLEVDGLLIDITAEQFNSNFNSLITIIDSIDLPIYQNKIIEPCRLSKASTDGSALIKDYDLIIGYLKNETSI